ncbi:MAG: hypothetical protein QW806_09590 [Nitrososphaerota archaeon]
MEEKDLVNQQEEIDEKEEIAKEVELETYVQSEESGSESDISNSESESNSGTQESEADKVASGLLSMNLGDIEKLIEEGKIKRSETTKIVKLMKAMFESEGMKVSTREIRELVRYRKLVDKLDESGKIKRQSLSEREKEAKKKKRKLEKQARKKQRKKGK